MNSKPNLFDFSPSRYSQNAFLGWLVSWADSRHSSRDNALHERAVEFVKSLMRECDKKPDPEEGFRVIDIRHRYKNIDVLYVIKHGRKMYVLLIENTTGTGPQDDPLRSHREIIEKDFPLGRYEHMLVYLKTIKGNTDGEITTPIPYERMRMYLKTVEGEVPAHLKTWPVSEASKVKAEGYRIYSGEDLMEVLDKGVHEIRSDIFRDFLEYLREKDGSYYRNQPVAEWGMQEWEDFVCALQREMPKENIEWSNGPDALVALWEKSKSFKYDSDVGKEIHYYEDDGSHFLAFTVTFWLDVPESYQSKVCDELCEYLKRSMQRHGWGDVVDRPKEFITEETIGPSKTVFCLTTNQDCWLAKNADGRLDMEKTVENLRKAEEILQDAFQDTGLDCETFMAIETLDAEEILQDDFREIDR